jgi:hypothetical protein
MLAGYFCISESDTDRLRGLVLVNHRPSPFHLLPRLTEFHTALCETYGTDPYGSRSVLLPTTVSDSWPESQIPIFASYICINIPDRIQRCGRTTPMLKNPLYIPCIPKTKEIL